MFPRRKYFLHATEVLEIEIERNKLNISLTFNLADFIAHRQT